MMIELLKQASTAGMGIGVVGMVINLYIMLRAFIIVLEYIDFGSNKKNKGICASTTPKQNDICLSTTLKRNVDYDIVFYRYTNTNYEKNIKSEADFVVIYEGDMKSENIVYFDDSTFDFIAHDGTCIPYDAGGTEYILSKSTVLRKDHITIPNPKYPDTPSHSDIIQTYRDHLAKRYTDNKYHPSNMVELINYLSQSSTK